MGNLQQIPVAFQPGSQPPVAAAAQPAPRAQPAAAQPAPFPDYPNLVPGAGKVKPVPGFIPQKNKPQHYSDGRYSDDGSQKWRTNLQGAGVIHGGLDIATALLTPIAAAREGRAFSDPITDYGNVVAIWHPDGRVSFYAHLDAPGNFKDTPVTAGQIIGRVGATGNADPRAPHLHLEVWNGGIQVDRNGRIMLPPRGLPRAQFREDPLLWLQN